MLYTSEDGLAHVQLRAIGGTAWLPQPGIAELFGKDVRTINEHIRNVITEGEVDPSTTIRKFRIVQNEGNREVARGVEHYNLDVILAVGYRVRSARGVQFRRWATTVLSEYLVKGFAMDDAKLKDVKQWDYFDEWLERIRDVRASEKRFYQKVLGLRQIGRTGLLERPAAVNQAISAIQVDPTKAPPEYLLHFLNHAVDG